MDMVIFSALALLIYLALLVRTTYRLWDSDRYKANQKLARTAMLLLLPILGEILVRHALSPPNYFPRGMPLSLFPGVWAAHHIRGDSGPFSGGAIGSYIGNGATSSYVGNGGGYDGGGYSGGGSDCGSGGFDSGGSCGGGYSS